MSQPTDSSYTVPTQHLSGAEAYHLNGDPKPTELEIEITAAIDQFETTEQKNWDKVSSNARLDRSRMIERFATKLKREAFRLKHQGFKPDEIRQALKQSMGNYKGLLTQFEKANKDYQEGKQQERSQNQDLKSRILNATFEALAFAGDAHAPHLSIPASKQPPAEQKEQPPAVDPYQNTQDEIDRSMWRLERKIDQIPQIRRESYLRELQRIETQLTDAMNANKKSPVGDPCTSHYCTEKRVESFHYDLKKEFNFN